MGPLRDLATRNFQRFDRDSLLLDPDCARLPGQATPGPGISSDVPLLCGLYPHLRRDERTGYLEYLACKLLAHRIGKSCHRFCCTGNGDRARSSDSKGARNAQPERIGTSQCRTPT